MSDLIERSNAKTLKELFNQGYTTIPTSGAAKEIFGMQRGKEVYLCFLADTEELQKERQKILLDYIDDSEKTREVPNIPLICVKVE